MAEAVKVEERISEFERGRAQGIIEAAAIARAAATNAEKKGVDVLIVRTLIRLEREIADLLGDSSNCPPPA